jgi:hypothetical protein
MMIAEDDARYAYEIVARICTEIGPGAPGSAQEWERAAAIEQELALHLGGDNVAMEPFTMAPGAFLSAYSMSGFFLLLAALLNSVTGRLTGVSPYLTAIAALTFAVSAPLSFVIGFVFNIELVDRFLPKRQSVNVVGTLRTPGRQGVQRLLILSGHHDSAPENRWLQLLGYGFFVLLASWFLGLATMLVMSIIQLAGVIASNVEVIRSGTLGWVLLAYPLAPAILFAVFFSRGTKNGGTVPGAADNLSGSALVVAMCRFLVRNPSFIPAGTEIRFVSFGSEEAGCRGSRRYVARHLEELQRLDVRVLNFETIAHAEVSILTSDVNGTVKHAPTMVRSVIAAAERARVPYKVNAASLGTGTDAAPFSHAGLKATTLLGLKVPQQMVAFYHQKWDRPEVLTMEPLLNVLKLALDWVRNGGAEAGVSHRSKEG